MRSRSENRKERRAHRLTRVFVASAHGDGPVPQAAARGREQPCQKLRCVRHGGWGGGGVEVEVGGGGGGGGCSAWKKGAEGEYWTE